MIDFPTKTKLRIKLSFPWPTLPRFEWNFEENSAYPAITICNKSSGDELAEFFLGLTMSARDAERLNWLLPDRREEYNKGWFSRPHESDES